MCKESSRSGLGRGCCTGPGKVCGGLLQRQRVQVCEFADLQRAHREEVHTVLHLGGPGRDGGMVCGERGVEAARVAGINISLVKIAAYTMTGLYAFISGLILAALFNSGLPDAGRDLALDSISGVILGGTAISGGVGTIWGTLGGCLIMASLNNGMSLLGAQYHVQIFVKGLVIIFAVLMDNAFKRK